MKLNEQLNTRNILGVACLLALSGAMSAKADLIDVQFSPDTAMTGAAATGSAGDQWNQIQSGSSVSDLNDTTGTASTVGLSWSDSSGSAIRSRSGFDSLTSGKLDGFSGGGGEGFKSVPVDFTFSGLTPDGTYDLFVYAGNYSNESTVTTVGGIQQNIADTPGLTAYVSGGNYTEFSVVADGSGDLSFAVQNSTVTSPTTVNTPVNGFQLETAQSSNATPEPSTWGLLGGGLALIAAAARKRSNFCA
jgi:hypothetical protein